MNVIIGMIKFKLAMRKIRKEKVFTEEGWKKCCGALQFMEPDQREGFMAQFMLVATQM